MSSKLGNVEGRRPPTSVRAPLAEKRDAVPASPAANVVADSGLENLPKAQPLALEASVPEIDPAVAAKLIRERAANPAVRRSILGALLFLDDNQVRERPGRRSSRCDASAGDGNRPALPVNLPGTDAPVFIPIPGESVRNEVGEWATPIRAAKLPTLLPDSMVFGAPLIAYPLFLFDEKSLPASDRFVSEIRKLASSNVQRFKRGSSYNFWREIPEPGEVPRVGPYYVPRKFFGKLLKFVMRGPLKPMLSPLMREPIGAAMGAPVGDPAVDKCLDNLTDPKRNPYGADMIFNATNDADDTAVVTALLKLHSAEYDPTSPDPYYRDPANFQTDEAALATLESFRDVGRSKGVESLESWKGPDSGAYLTWLKDEDAPLLANIEKGLIPVGVNNVDEVVNANAVFSMALHGRKSSEGFQSACKLIRDSAVSQHWLKEGPVYYSAVKLFFPYFASRAYRDGGADNSVMREAMKQLLVDVLQSRREYQEAHPDQPGAFAANTDGRTELSTAFGVTFLLNVGREIAEEVGVAAEYDQALKEGVDRLVSTAVPYRLKNDETFNRDGEEVSHHDRGVTWGDNFMGGASPSNFVGWSSEAAVASMSLEALTKYVLAYDQGGVDIRGGRRIQVDRYARSADEASDEFQFRVE